MGTIMDLLTRGPMAIAEFLAIAMFKFFVAFFQFMATAWMRYSTTDIFLGKPDPEANPIVNNGQSALAYITYALVLISFLWAIIECIASGRAGGIKRVGLLIVRVVIAQGVAVTLAFGLMQAGDVAGPWLAAEISGTGIDQLMSEPLIDVDMDAATKSMKADAAVVSFFLMANMIPLIVIAGVINFLFVIGSYVIALIVMVFLPSLAAQSLTETGKQRFDRAVGWLLAAAVYKIIAGVIWGISLSLVTMNTFAGDESSVDKSAFGGAPIGYLLTGFVALVMTTLILPVLIRLAVPAMAGVSGLGVGRILGTVAVTAGVAAGAIATSGVLSAGTSAAGAAAKSLPNGTPPPGPSPAGQQSGAITQGGNGATPTGSPTSQGSAPQPATPPTGQGNSAAQNTTATPPAQAATVPAPTEETAAQDSGQSPSTGSPASASTETTGTDAPTTAAASTSGTGGAGVGSAPTRRSGGGARNRTGPTVSTASSSGGGGQAPAGSQGGAITTAPSSTSAPSPAPAPSAQPVGTESSPAEKRAGGARGGGLGGNLSQAGYLANQLLTEGHREIEEGFGEGEKL